MRRTRKIPVKGLLPVLLCAASLACATASDRVWGALLCATNKVSPEVPESLACCMPAIQETFGYNSVRILGEKRARIQPGTTDWLIPSKEFFLKLNFQDRKETAYPVQVELYHKKKRILSAKVELGRDAPLYIKGPVWGKGQLIIVLAVR